jgi:hypothetical protein
MFERWGNCEKHDICQSHENCRMALNNHGNPAELNKISVQLDALSLHEAMTDFYILDR